MQRESDSALRIGDWCVRPASGQMSRDGETVRVEARTMRLLVCLARHAGEVVSIDDLLDEVWSGVTVTPDSVYQAVASLRRLLGDDSKEPTYISTVPRLGYQMVADVSPWSDRPVMPTSASLDAGRVVLPVVDAPSSDAHRRPSHLAAVGIALALAFVASVWFFGRAAIKQAAGALPATAPLQKSIAVLPFLDLTDEMNHELFVDGMTEELVDKLSKVPGLQVPPARSSLAFKGQKAAIGDIARALGTAYVLDGSVRQSGDTLRVAARLVRVESGFVVWSGTYDRRSGDLVMIEDEIAAEVAKSLSASVGGGQ